MCLGKIQTRFQVGKVRQQSVCLIRSDFLFGLVDKMFPSSGASIMEADDRQVTTNFTVQPSFHHRHLTNCVSWSINIVGERAVTPHLVVRRWRQCFMILGLSSADCGMTVGLWKLSSLDSRRPPWYRHLEMVQGLKFWPSHTQDWQIGILVANQPDPLRPCTKESALGLVDMVSVFCVWIRELVWSSTSVSVWQPIKLLKQLCLWYTLCSLPGHFITKKQTINQIQSQWVRFTVPGNIV